MKKSRLVIIAAAVIVVFIAALAYGQMKDISDQEFQQEVLSSPSPVMVEFWSPKCPHCLKMANDGQCAVERIGRKGEGGENQRA